MKRNRPLLSCIVILLICLFSPAVGFAQDESVLLGTEAFLYQSGPIITHPGAGFGGADVSAVQDISLGLTKYGYCHWGVLNNKVADDFVVDDAGGWTIDTLCFYGFQAFTGTTSPVTALKWQILDADPRTGGNIICSDSATLDNGRLFTDWSGIYRTLEADIPTSSSHPVMYNRCIVQPPCVVEPGTYWVVIQAWSTMASCFWSPCVSIPGVPATGNGLYFVGAARTWLDAFDGPHQQGIPFEVKGSVNSAPNDIPCQDLTALLARCLTSGGGTVQARVTLMNSTIHAGKTVEFSVDADRYTATVVTNGIHSRAQISATGYGPGNHVVALTDPSGCLNPMTVNCRSGVTAGGDDWADGDAIWELGGGVLVSQAQTLENYPNPFNPSTTIRYGLRENSWVTLKVYDVLGREVRTLVDEFQSAGVRSVNWIGASDEGQVVASGVYIYRLITNHGVTSRRMLFAR